MADTTPLLASLLMGQRQEENPFTAQRKYGRGLMVQGASTAPLGSGNPLEGLARALQAGIGGIGVGLADKEEQDQNQYNIGLMSDAAKVALQDPAKATEILKGLKGGGYEQQALLGQIVQQGINTGLANQTAKAQIDAGGYGPQGQGNGGTSITITPGQQPGTTPQPPSALNNNIMNIRQSGTPWEGKGQPQNGFETFPTPQAGANATAQNFATYVKDNPNITVAQAIAKWAPPNENNTGAYVSRVAEATGINPGQPLAQVMQNPVDMARLMEAGTQVEKGGMPQGVTPDVLVNAGQRVAPQGSQPPMQIPSPTSSSKGAILRAQADKLSQAGQHAAALPLYKAAVEADATYADDVSKRDVPGTPAGDVAVLQSAIRNPQIAATPEYAAAYARLGKPQMAQGGQLYFPDMTAYPKPAGGQTAQGGRFQDTPESQFKIAQSLHQEYQQDQAVKNWKTIEPVITTMRSVVGNPNKAADLDLAAGLATLYAPQGGGNLPRGEMLKHLLNVESLPAEIRTAIAGALSGQGMGPEARAAIMAQAEARAGAHKQQFDAVTQQYQQRAAKYQIAPEDFMTGPASSQQPAEAAPKVRNFNPATGRLE